MPGSKKWNILQATVGNLAKHLESLSPTKCVMLEKERCANNYLAEWIDHQSKFNKVSEHHSKWRREIFGRLLSAAPRAKGTLYFVCLPKFQDKAVQYSNIVSALQEQSAYNEARIVDLEGSAVKSSTEISTLDRKLSETTDQICQTSIKILALDEQGIHLCIVLRHPRWPFLFDSKDFEDIDTCDFQRQIAQGFD
ncbi:hypothetical protein DI09_18p190 [Mitosporidium daphniae]|uniref:Uncharacterized protein n=1 Tax=Mitosporidium daphniae TaxID=1485682 RepID=A0A098VT99_9MICR|nr:uncharacterized protein DI09_18p190 [Mitosporidium daphniae]KGG52313.1 hypothetical protein DI09_18p190 [Mitosporidium daphniae]|eukprot:XP_013238740.1 uncharacterized protein DI09_18p190 [Mitosporidium daphniae]